MINVHAALARLNMDKAVKVSSPVALSALANSYPPSAGVFKEELAQSVMKPMLDFLARTGSDLMTGWPSKGDAKEVGAGAANAAAYNGNLVRRVLSRNAGTPRRPDADVDVYLFALFNENQKPGPTSERNYGVFYPNQQKVYDVEFVLGAGGGSVGGAGGRAARTARGSSPARRASSPTPWSPTRPTPSTTTTSARAAPSAPATSPAPPTSSARRQRWASASSPPRSETRQQWPKGEEVEISMHRRRPNIAQPDAGIPSQVALKRMQATNATLLGQMLLDLHHG
ncbi:Glucan endo-1,3-beta-glucosidase 14 [Triticum urartu]|uniref:Glucan endo-1,3-beta-glucosidase 14 n=1 Tax=Triticum urartu TaxID=4572 RepID=M7ZII4_TRIUA|nr:Glucan endo-1,3-beta-glucosidase 14 [Triticum urartu]